MSKPILDGNSRESHFAYDPEFKELETVMRFQAVKRWHMIDTTRIQNIAEHSANVAALAYVIAMKAPGVYFGAAEGCAREGLFHDLEETFTGDAPTPVKMYGSIKRELAALALWALPSMFRPLVGSQVKLLVKLCDQADSIRFIRQHGVDLTAEHAKAQVEAGMQVKLKEAENDWPIEVFALVRKYVTFYAYEFH